MKFIPVNKHLLVEKQEDQVSHLVPEEFRDNLSPFTVVKILDIADDCEKISPQGDPHGIRLVVQTNGIEQVKMFRDTFHIVSENFVVGILED